MSAIPTGEATELWPTQYSNASLLRTLASGIAPDASIRDAAREFARWNGVNAVPEKGCKFARLPLGPLDVLVEYEYDHGQREYWNARDGVGGPEIPPSVSIISVLLNGQWVDVGDLLQSPAIVDVWETEIIEREQE